MRKKEILAQKKERLEAAIRQRNGDIINMYLTCSSFEMDALRKEIARLEKEVAEGADLKLAREWLAAVDADPESFPEDTRNFVLKEIEELERESKKVSLI